MTGSHRSGLLRLEKEKTHLAQALKRKERMFELFSDQAQIQSVSRPPNLLTCHPRISLSLLHSTAHLSSFLRVWSIPARMKRGVQTPVRSKLEDESFRPSKSRDRNSPITACQRQVLEEVGHSEFAEGVLARVPGHLSATGLGCKKIEKVAGLRRT